MLEYNEIRPKEYILFEGEPYEVLESHVFRKQQRKPVNATKLKNLISGRVVEYSFHASEKAEQADIVKQEIKYLYSHRDEIWFCDPKDPSKRFQLEQKVVGDALKWIKPNSVVTALVFNDKIFAVQTPVKVVLKVKDAPPGIQGDTSRAGMKQVTLETGTVINTPLFVNTDDFIEINTDTGSYVSRVDQKK
jgi:elongation factor P